MISEQCYPFISDWPNTLNLDNAESLLVSNVTSDIASSPILLPDPNPDLLSWTYVSKVIQNVAMVDWTLFVISLVVPRKLSLKKLTSTDKFRVTLEALENIEFILKELTKALFGICFIIISLPIVIVAVGIFGTAGFIVDTILFRKYGETVTRTDPLDAIWGCETPESRPFITSYITLSGKPSINKIRSVVQQRILNATDATGRPLYRKFQQRLDSEYGYFVWKDVPNFDIRKHIYIWKKSSHNVKYSTARHNNSTRDSEELVLDYMNNHGWRQMTSDKPKWEIVLLNEEASPDGK